MKRFLSLAICFLLMFGAVCQTAFAADADAKLLSQPYDLTVTQLVSDEGNPFGGVVLHFKIDNMPEMADGADGKRYSLDFECKIGNDGEWKSFGRNPVDMFGAGYGFEPPNKYQATDTWAEDYKNMVVSYRARMIIEDVDTIFESTPWSNVATVGIKASAWATAEIGKAMGYGLVPDSIKDDFTSPITREEFAELAVRFYEVYTGQKAEPAPEDTFIDCKNPEVLKANKLGIVNGVGEGKFDPKSLTNREQIAAMLNRAVKVVAPETDLSIVGAPTFNDEASIAPYFLENVKFMSKNAFIKGADGKFDPKGTCTREMAVLIAVRVYEFYKK